MRNLEETLLQWSKEDGFQTKHVPPTPDRQWAFIVHVNQGFALEVFRSKGSKRIMMGVGANVPPEDQERQRKLSKDEREKLWFAFRRAAFQGGMVGVAPRLDPESFIIQGWSMDSWIYDDSINHQSFAETIRRIHSKHLELVDALAEAIGNGPWTARGGGQAIGGNPSGYQ